MLLRRTEGFLGTLSFLIVGEPGLIGNVTPLTDSYCPWGQEHVFLESHHLSSTEPSSWCTEETVLNGWQAGEPISPSSLPFQAKPPVPYRAYYQFPALRWVLSLYSVTSIPVCHHLDTLSRVQQLPNTLLKLNTPRKTCVFSAKWSVFRSSLGLRETVWGEGGSRLCSVRSTGTSSWGDSWRAYSRRRRRRWPVALGALTAKERGKSFFE